jgi:hypothetical protein
VPAVEEHELDAARLRREDAQIAREVVGHPGLLRNRRS